MSNPLSLIRKYQKIMLVVFGVLIIIVFVVGTSVEKWASSQGGGGSGGPEGTVVSWKGGNLNEYQLRQLRDRHGVLQKFLRRIAAETSKREGQPKTFSIPTAAGEEELVARLVLSEQAKEMGVVVSDDAVQDYLDQLSDQTLEDEEFRDYFYEASRGFAMTEGQLFDQLRLELAASHMRQMALKGQATSTMGAPAALPSEAWLYHQRLNRRLITEVLPFDVSEYVAKVEETPKDDQLKELFEKHKEQYPNPFSPDPGFRQRLRLQFQYFVISYDTYFKEEVKKVTADEIKAEYDKRIAQGQYEIIEPDPVAPANPENDAPVDDSAPAPNKFKGEAPADEQKQPPTPGSTDPATKPAEQPAEQPGAKKPADEPAKKPEDAKPPEGECLQENETPPAKPAAQPAAKAPLVKPSTPIKAKAPVQPGVEKPVDDAKKADDPKKADDAKPVVTVNDKAATVPEAAAPKPKKYRPLEEVSEDIKLSLARPKAEDRVAAAEKAIKRILDRYSTRYDRWSIAAPVVGVVDKNGRSLMGKGATIWKVFNSNQIVELIQNEGTDTEKNLGTFEVANISRSELQLKRPDGSRPNLPAGQKVSVKPAALNFDDVMATHGVVHKEQRLLDALQIADTDLGKAQNMSFDFSGGRFQQNVQTFAEIAYQPGVPLYKPAVIDGPDGPDTKYVYWRIQEKGEFIPEFEDDGVKAQVVEAWKRIQAFELAKKDAEAKRDKAIADESAGKPFTETLGDAAAARLLRPAPFAWLTLVSSQNSMPFGGAPQSVPRLTEIEGVEGANEEFMKTVFEHSAGDVFVVANQQRSFVYLFRVEAETPSVELQREQFLEAKNPDLIDPQDPFSRPKIEAQRQAQAQEFQLSQIERSRFYFNWYEQLMKEHKVSWARDPQFFR